MGSKEQNSEFEFDARENDFSNSENEGPEEEREKIELPYTVPLEVPVTIGGTTYTELTFKEALEVGMMKHIPADQEMKGMKIGHFIPVIAAMCQVPPIVIEKLKMRDFTNCTEVAARFF